MSGSTKDAVLSRIRRANGARPNDEERQRAVEARLSGRPLGVVPARGQLPEAERVGLFVAMAEAANATVARIGSMAELPGEAARYLRERNLPATLKMGTDRRLSEADFSTTAIEVTRGASEGDDLNSLSHAEAGIAETGTLVLTSGPDNPTSLNFLPENHIVVIEADAIEGATPARAPWRGAAKDGQHDHRPLPFGRYRTDAASRRPWAEGAAYRRAGQDGGSHAVMA